MEIKVDTKKDSHDDIRKMIAFLQKFIETSDHYGSYGSNESSTNDDFNIPATNMFDSPTPEPEHKDDDEVTIIEY